MVPMHRLSSSLRLGSLVLAALVLLPAPVTAQERGARNRSRSEALLRAFRPVVADVARSTVRVVAVSDDEEEGPRELALGVIVSSDGYILTKSSELTKKLVVQLHDNRRFEARQLVADPELDLALLKVDATDLPAIAWAKSEPAVGQWLATASPGNLPAAVGVVSVKPRSIPRERAGLGVIALDVETGAKIDMLAPESAALKAGLKAGDVILEAAGKLVRGRADLQQHLSAFRAGEIVEFKIQREDETVVVQVRLGRISGESQRGAFQNQLGGELSDRRDGFPSAIQHDTVLRPEECGGPIVGLDGKALGLNIARAGRTESYALPAAAVMASFEAMKRDASLQVQASTGDAPSGR